MEFLCIRGILTRPESSYTFILDQPGEASSAPPHSLWSAEDVRAALFDRTLIAYTCTSVSSTNMPAQRLLPRAISPQRHLPPSRRSSVAPSISTTLAQQRSSPPSPSITCCDRWLSRWLCRLRYGHHVRGGLRVRRRRNGPHAHYSRTHSRTHLGRRPLPSPPPRVSW